MHRSDDFLVALWAGDLQDLRMAVENFFGLSPEATGDDYFAVRSERLADRLEGLVHRGVDEAAGIDDDQIRRRVA